MARGDGKFARLHDEATLMLTHSEARMVMVDRRVQAGGASFADVEATARDTARKRGALRRVS